MTTQVPPSALLPLNPEQLARLQATHDRFNSLPSLPGFLAISGGVLNQQPAALAATPAPAAEMPGITIISASQTGNARRVAEALRDDLLAAKLNVKLVNAGDYKFKQIASEKTAHRGDVNARGKGNRRKKPSRCISSCSPKKSAKAGKHCICRV